MPESVTTFSRRRKVGQEPSSSNPLTTPLTRGVMEGGAEASAVESPATKAVDAHETTALYPAPRWRRKPVNEARRADQLQLAEIAEIQAYFHEVDTFDLVSETPTPLSSDALESCTMKHPAYRRAAASRPMSLGLSRRMSVGGVGHLSAIPSINSGASPPRSNEADNRSVDRAGPTSSSALTSVARAAGVSMSGNPGHVEAGGEDPNPSSADPERSLLATSALVRLSNGIADALHWFSGRGSMLGRKHASADCAATMGSIPNGTPLVKGLHEEGPFLAAAASDVCGATHLATSKPQAATASVVAVDCLQAELFAKLRIECDAQQPVHRGVCGLTPLEQLLQLCGQQDHIDALPSMDQLLGQHVDLAQLRKIGEGTYGEAFKAGDVVLKIVPMEGQLQINGEVQKRAPEILAEVAVALTLSSLRGGGDAVSATGASGMPAAAANVTSAFVETYGVGVCRGRYSPELCAEWRRWDREHTSDNDCVDIFDDEQQLFCVFVVADGGLDLEHFTASSFEELHSILMQVTLALAVAEEACEFEHRDLHWGNLLIRRDGREHVKCRLRDVDIEAAASGVSVTLIDFTLSRLRTSEGEVAFSNLEADMELFRGPRGDAQAETYRRMRKLTQADWQRHTAATNALWLHYLAETMLTHKLPTGCGRDERWQLRRFRKRAMDASAAAELLWDEFFAGQWTSLPASGTSSPASGTSSLPAHGSIRPATSAQCGK